MLKAAPVVQTAPIATHFQQPHKHFSDGGPPRPQSTKKNWTRAARRNFQQNMTTSGRPARERESEEVGTRAKEANLLTAFIRAGGGMRTSLLQRSQ